MNPINKCNHECDNGPVLVWSPQTHDAVGIVVVVMKSPRKSLESLRKSLESVRNPLESLRKSLESLRKSLESHQQAF